MHIEKSTLAGGDVRNLSLPSASSLPEISVKHQLIVHNRKTLRIANKNAKTEKERNSNWMSLPGKPTVQNENLPSFSVSGIVYPIRPYAILHAPSRLCANVNLKDRYDLDTTALLHAPAYISANVTHKSKFKGEDHG